MAKKQNNSRKQVSESTDTLDQVSSELKEAAEPETAAVATGDTPGTKPGRAKPMEDSSSGNVGLGDIRKAVAFANSVGGLDKAIALLQIVKVAKEVQ